MKEATDLPFDSSPTQTCVVYDQRTGRVVHVHDFVPAEPGGSSAPSEMRAAALDATSSLAEKQYLAIAEVPEDLLGSEGAYRVNAETGKVYAEPLDPGPKAKKGKDRGSTGS